MNPVWGFSKDAGLLERWHSLFAAQQRTLIVDGKPPGDVVALFDLGAEIGVDQGFAQTLVTPVDDVIVGQYTAIDTGGRQAGRIGRMHAVVDAFRRPGLARGHRGLEIDYAQIGGDPIELGYLWSLNGRSMPGSSNQMTFGELGPGAVPAVGRDHRAHQNPGPRTAERRVGTER